VVISDSDSTVIRFWGRWTLRAEVSGLSKLEEWADLTLLCAPNIPWEPDPLRSLPNSNDRKQLHQLYVDDLQSRKDHPWTLIDGLTHEKRLEQSVRAVQYFRDTSVFNG
jgi:nicotinamide riboside kinase